MHKLLLENRWDYCPQSWKNFTNHIESVESIPEGYGVSHHISDYLSPYNATYDIGDMFYGGHVEFASVEDAVAFELKYG